MTPRTTISPTRKTVRPRGALASKAAPLAPGEPTRIMQITEMLKRSAGASVDELCEATGWQAHSVRGAIAGTLKKKGHSITSERVEGIRRYRIGASQ